MINIQKLIVGTQNGSNRSYEKLYEIYKEKIGKFLLFKVFEKIKTYDATKSKFDTWVIMIAKNYMIDKSRKHTPIYVSFTSNTFTSDNIAYSSTPTMSTSFKMIEPASLSSSPHDTLETNDSLNFISNKISINDFSMLTMNSEGYSYNEIAKEFNSNESKISNKINYTRSKIKKDDE